MTTWNRTDRDPVAVALEVASLMVREGTTCCIGTRTVSFAHLHEYTRFVALVTRLGVDVLEFERPYVGQSVLGNRYTFELV